MEWYEIAVDGGRTVKFSSRVLQPGGVAKYVLQSDGSGATPAAEGDCAGAPQQQGGILKQGGWAWLSSGNVLEITALRTGQTIATYEFTETRGYDNCCIRCVEEFYPYNNNETLLLAVCLECFRAAGGGCTFVAIYSVEHSQVLSCMELPLHVTAAVAVSSNCCRRSLLQNFDGCLAVGSEEGVILLLDLNINKILAAREERICTLINHHQVTDVITLCQIVDYNLPLAEIHRAFRQTRQDGIHFGLQVEVIDTPSAVQCLLPIDLALGLAIGLEDGRLAFYDLAELQIIYIAIPQPQQTMSPVVKLTYLEPLDDPRHCLYVWAMHENGKNLSAVLHTLIYEKLLREQDGFYYFESFLRSTVRLQLPLESTKSTVIDCQAVKKMQYGGANNTSVNSVLNATNTDEDGYCLCALTWYSTVEEKNKLLIFDLNQWYKDEMPYAIMQQKCPSYLAGYVLSGRQCALSAYLNPNTVAHFNSLQRCEEHFYPNSLSFDCALLLETGTLGYTWIGAQNKIINILRASNSSIFLEPDLYFREILRTRLLPQFSELNVDSTFSRPAIYETILSVALEHNCFSLLRDCAKCWADGSFMGSNFTATTGISLSTLTDWIWKRATDNKTRCNELSKGFFDYNGYPLDQREQKELGYLTRQLKLLGDLLREVLATGKRYIPDKVFVNLETQHKSIRMASEYQDVLLWLHNIGLLPEMQRKQRKNYSYYSSLHAKNGDKGVRGADNSSSNNNIIEYPYKDLRNLYERKRKFFACVNENLISKKTGSCRLLFIDALIAHECKADSLRECWLESGGNGLYPPPSIEAMLRVILVPEMEFESKCAVLLYFFLDLHMTINEHAHKEIVNSFVKFPSVFKLTATLIKTVQSLWNLDHGLFMPAVDEFISPFNNNQTYPQWMVELLIESLLTQNASNYALRILEARPTLISPILKLNTLLANDLISEAFHFARTKHDETLLEFFFNICLCAGKYGVIRDLALTEREGQLVQRILRNSKTHGAENLHFVYLLQKSKYIEAVSYLDELSRAKSMRSSHYGNESNILNSVGGAGDTQNLVLSAFNTTMAPVTQGLTDVYFRIKNKIKKKEADNRSPVPLSCQLIKQNANNLLGGIYHSSALSAHFATYYWGGGGEEMDYEQGKRSGATAANNKTLLSADNAPFLRKPQADICNFHGTDGAPTDVSYPQPYRPTEKRTFTERELDEQDEVVAAAANAQQQPHKRRRLLRQEIVENVSHFMQMNKSAKHLTASGFHLQPAENVAAQQEKSTPPSKTQMRSNEEYLRPTLTTPSRQLATFEDGKGAHSVLPTATATVTSRAASELHSILKSSNTPDRHERAHSLRRELHTTLEENKNLRFKLPATDIAEEELEEDDGEKKEVRLTTEKEAHEERAVKGHSRIVTTTTSINETELREARATVSRQLGAQVKEMLQEDVEMAEEDDEVVDEVVIEVRHEKPVASVAATKPPPVKSKAVARSVSVESNGQNHDNEEGDESVLRGRKQKAKCEGDEGDEEEEEDEDFYSPLSSRNNSLIADRKYSSPPAPPPLTRKDLATDALQKATAKIFRFSGPQPRKPLARLSTERSQSRTPEKTLPSQQTERKGENQRTPQTTPPQSKDEYQPSSGYVSAAASTISATAVVSSSKPAFEIKSVISLASSDFAPRISSSKLYATQSKQLSFPASRAKLHECSTMVGTFTMDESVFAAGTDKTDDKFTKEHKTYSQLAASPGDELTRQPLPAAAAADTTLGMSTYEFTLPQIKSQMTTQAGRIEMDNTKEKSAATAATLKTMETVEVMDMDNEEVEVENANENENGSERYQEAPNADYDATEAEAVAERGLYAEVQQTEHVVNVMNIDHGFEDSNDVVSLYERRRAEIEKHNAENAAAAAAAVNESNSSSVIILSSSASSLHMSADSQESDSDSEGNRREEDEYVEGDDDKDDDDEDECEDEDEDQNENESESNDEDYDDDREDSSAMEDYEDDIFAQNYGQAQRGNYYTSAAIEIFDESNSSVSGGVKAAEKTKEVEKNKRTDEVEAEADKQEKDNETDTGQIEENNDSSQPPASAASLESECQIVVVEAGSNSCADCEELVMHESIDFEECEDAGNNQQQNQTPDTKETSFYSSRSVFMQNEAEITIEEIKVSTYKTSSKEVYEELSGDVFYCDAADASMDSTHQVELTDEMPSTSSKVFSKIAKLSENLRKEVSKGSKLDVEVEAPRSEHSKIAESLTEQERNAASADATATLPSTTAFSKADEVAETKKDTPLKGTPTKTVERKVDREEVKEMRKENTVEEKETKQTKSVPEEEEEQIKLHVDECDLSGAEDNATPAKVVEKSIEPCVEQATQKTAKSPHKDLEYSPQPMETSNESKAHQTTSVAPLEEKEPEALVSTPTRKRYSHRRGTSVPPQPTPTDATTATTPSTPVADLTDVPTQRRNTRGISMPPQARGQQEDHDDEKLLVRTSEAGGGSARRSIRATSMQPNEAAEIGTPIRTRRRSIREVSASRDNLNDEHKSNAPSTPVRSGRGTSMPPGAAAKIVTRRRSALLDAINENVPIVDSPSARTRSRMRLNSTESELDSSIVSETTEKAAATPKTKRTRRTSISSSVSEQPTTPGGGRRTRSSLNAAGATSETASETGTPKSQQRGTTRRRESIDNATTQPEATEDRQERKESKEMHSNAAESALYSSARRLTRTQLAMMEKSTALGKNAFRNNNTAALTISSPTTRRISNRRNSRSTMQDSDDTESVSSRISNVSGAPAPKRRVTRSSVKDKEENDDDLASLASSVGSERMLKRRSKESKSSPNITLSTIQEDEAEGW